MTEFLGDTICTCYNAWNSVTPPPPCAVHGLWYFRGVPGLFESPQPRPAVVLVHQNKSDCEALTFYSLDEAERWLNDQLDFIAGHRESIRAKQ